MKKVMVALLMSSICMNSMGFRIPQTVITMTYSSPGASPTPNNVILSSQVSEMGVTVSGPSGEMPIAVSQNNHPGFGGQRPPDQPQAPTRVSPSEGAAHTANRGFATAADLRGMAELDRRVKMQEMARKYQNWLNQVNARMKPFFDQQPRRQRDLKELLGQPADLNPHLSFDNIQSQSFSGSGEAYVIMGFLPASDVAGLMNLSGVSVSLGSKEGMGVFKDTLEGFAQLENGFYSNLKKDARDDTGKMGVSVSDEIKRIEDQIFRRTPPPQTTISGQIRDPIDPRFNRVKDKIDSISPTTPVQSAAHSVARQSYDAAVEASQGAFPEDASHYLEYAETLADIAIGIDPASGFARSLVEATTGCNVVTGAKLSEVERGFAVVGVLSAGSFSSVRQGLRIAAKLGANTALAQRLISKAQKTGQNVPKILNSLSKTYDGAKAKVFGKSLDKELAQLEKALLKKMDDFEVLEIMDTESMNKELFKPRAKFTPPMKMNDYGFEVATKADEKFVRVSVLSSAQNFGGKSNPAGGYLMKESELMDLKFKNESASKTAGKIRDRYSIPGESPVYISEVHVPAGTKMYVGPVGKNYGGSEGATQYVLREELPRDNFGKNLRTIEEWKRGE